MAVPKLAKAAMNLSSPIQERSQAMAEFQMDYLPTRSDLPNPSDVDTLVGYCANAYEDQWMAKGSQMGGAVWNGLTVSDRRTKGPLSPKTVYVDERGIFGNVPGGYRRRASLFGSDHLRLLAEHVPLIQAIIGRRQRTIQRFLRPAERDRDVGFEIRRRDDERPLRANDDHTERELTDYVLHSGMEHNPNRMRYLKRDTLTQFMKKSVRDLLTLDAWAIETVMTRNGKQMAGYHAVDAGTIYLASEQGYEGEGEIIAVQLVNGLPVTTYTADDLVYLIQDPRTDILHHGYGYAPTEKIVKVVTGYLNALTYNLRGFDENSIPKGLLTLYGNYDQNQLRAFKQQWNAMVSGVNNAWKLPVLVSDSKESAAKFEKLGIEWSDMYFAKWMTLLTSIICSIYGMDPTEVYSEAFHAGRSSLSGSDRAEALADARDTGLEPLMSFIECSMTDHILSRINPDYKFRFFGLQPVDRAWRQEITKLTKTVDEARAMEGDGPHPDPVMGAAPLNPSLSGLYTTQVQAQQQAQMGQQGMDGDESEGNDEEAEPGLMESGDREQPPAKGPDAQLAESGDRGEGQEAGNFQNNPERAKGDKLFGPSSMAKSRIWRAPDVYVMG